MSLNTPPMDWYPDPADPARERYWDGTQWTQNTRAARGPSVGAPVNDPWQAQGQPQQAPSGFPGPGPYQSQTPAGGFGQGTATGAGPAPQPYQQYPGQYQQYPAGVRPGQPGSVAMTPDGVPLAGWWRRAFALFLDGIVCNVIGTILSWHWLSQLSDGMSRVWAAAMADARAGRGRPYTPEILAQYGVTPQLMAPVGWIGAAVIVAYLLLMWVVAGASLGQMAMGIRVVPTGEGRAPRRLAPGRALLRVAVWALFLVLPFVWGPASLLMPLGIVTAIMPLFTARRQGLHDIAARTQVVRSR